MGDQSVVEMASLTPEQEASLRAKPMPTDELLATFQALDPEGKGTVSGDEFFRALKIFGGASKFTDQEEQALRTELGCKKGDDFNYTEFIQLRDCLTERKVQQMVLDTHRGFSCCVVMW